MSAQVAKLALAGTLTVGVGLCALSLAPRDARWPDPA
jgi:hypothetical protein